MFKDPWSKSTDRNKSIVCNFCWNRGSLVYIETWTSKKKALGEILISEQVWVTIILILLFLIIILFQKLCSISMQRHIPFWCVVYFEIYSDISWALSIQITTHKVYYVCAMRCVWAVIETEKLNSIRMRILPLRHGPLSIGPSQRFCLPISLLSFWIFEQW